MPGWPVTSSSRSHTVHVISSTLSKGWCGLRNGRAKQITRKAGGVLQMVASQ